MRMSQKKQTGKTLDYREKHILYVSHTKGNKDTEAMLKNDHISGLLVIGNILLVLKFSY